MSAREMMSTRGTIRQEVIDNMDIDEVRELVLKVQMAFEGGYDVDEALFEEYVGEILAARTEEDDE